MNVRTLWRKFIKKCCLDTAATFFYRTVVHGTCRNKRKNKFGFQLRLVNQRSYVFAASSESELNNWLEKLCMAVHSSKQFSEDRKSLPDPGRSCLRKLSFHLILEFLFRINQFRTCIKINQRSNLLRNFKITRIIFEPTINQICS